MQRRSIFFDDWRECLRSHFFHVVKINDAVTEPTLRNVLMDAGISPEEIDEWYAEAVRLRDAENE